MSARPSRWCLTSGVLWALLVPAVAGASIDFSRTDVPLLHDGSPVSAESVAIADLDGEKGPDLVLAFPSVSTVGVMLNDGGGTFSTLEHHETGCPAQSVVDITLGDVTSMTGGLRGDGKLDAYVACSPNVVRLAGDGAGGFGAPVSFPLGVAPYIGSATLDLLALVQRPDPTAPPMLVFQAARSPYPSRRLCATYDLVFENRHCDTTAVHGPLAAGDLNGQASDEPPDEVVTGVAGGMAVFGFAHPPSPDQILWGNSTPRATPGAAEWPVESAAVADVEPDGDLDVVTGQYVGSSAARESSIHFWKWETGTGLEQNARPVSSIPPLDAVAVADIDGDACNDIVGAGAAGSGIVHPGDGVGGFGDGVEFPLIGFGDAQRATRVTMQVADLDGDGDRDLVVTDALGYQAPNQLMLLLNTSALAGSACYDDPPVTNDDLVRVAPNAAATQVDVLANDFDPDGGAAFAVTAVTQPARGAAAVTNGGADVRYTPQADFCGDDAFTYTVTGGSTANVRVTMDCENPPPTAVADAATVAEDAPAGAVDVLANDTNPGSGPMQVQSVAQPAHGATAITGGGSGLTYAPAAGYCGADSFTYTLNGGSAATVSVTVTCVDDAPAAVADAATVAQDGVATIDVLANDTDTDGGARSIASVTQGADGTVTGGSTAVYTPRAGFCGADSFTYTLNGGSSATVGVTVTCAPPKPKPPDPPPAKPAPPAAAPVPVPVPVPVEPLPLPLPAPPATGCGAPPAAGGQRSVRARAAAVFNGTAAADVIGGTPQNDTISALDGDDCVLGLGGNDTIDGGGGDDRLKGDGFCPGAFVDPVLCMPGGTGGDRIFGGAGKDVVDGDGGSDRLSGQAGDDRLRGGAGNDRIAGGSGADRLTGAAGNDFLVGSEGNDVALGASGNDTISGGTGRDELEGGGGNDEIRARDGARDRIRCGAGRDRVTADREDKVGSDCERVTRR